MKDTPIDILEMQRNILLNKTDSEKFIMSIDMYETSKAFVRSSIRNENHALSEKELHKEVFRRFYKNDFSDSEMKKILMTF